MIGGRTVVRYDWSFGDGEYISSTQSKVNHTYINSGWFDVKLTVTDATGTTKDFINSIYVFDTEVPYPDGVTNTSLSGIDTDSNGIRDDIQIWINRNSYGSSVVKGAMKELARVYKEQMNLSLLDQAGVDANITNLKSLEESKSIASECVNSMVESEYGVSKSVEFEMLYLNSNDRWLAYNKIKDYLSGFVPSYKIQNINIDPCTSWK